ncbi:MAG TPA: hypothetical protein VGF84_13690 [Micromonosporaceae bacterium]
MLQGVAASSLLVRLAVLLSAVAAMLLADPRHPTLTIVAVLPAIFLRGVMPDLFMAFVVVVWLVTTHADAGLVTTWRLSALALVLYYVHFGATIGAVLPFDAVVAPGTFRPLLVRAGLVSAVTVVIAILVSALAAVSGSGDIATAGTYVGLVLLVEVAAYLVYLGKRR